MVFKEDPILHYSLSDSYLATDLLILFIKTPACVAMGTVLVKDILQNILGGAR